MPDDQTTQLQRWIDRLRAGDAAARDELINSTCERLLKLTRKMLKSYPGVARWEQTDDVYQNAVLRLYKALKDSPIESVQHYFKLAALQIRRELIDLTRHYFGAQGPGAHHDTESNRSESPLAAAGQTTLDPAKLAQWAEFHEQVQALPAEEREVFDLLWYHGVLQAEAVSILGISERTLQRRWLSARRKLAQALQGGIPD